MHSALVNAAEEVISSGNYILGPKLEKFEGEFASFIGSEYCVGVGSGLHAIELTLRAHDFPSDGEVILPANTFIATALAVKKAGLKPKLVEPNPRTYNVEPSTIMQSVGKQTVAVVPVHLYGRPVNVRSIIELTNLPVIEDAAQAHGASYDGIKAGALGHAGAFSFYPSKNLGGFGDGGAIVTDDPHLYRVIKAMRNYGSERKYEHDFPGDNSRLDEIQAALLSVKLKHLIEETNRRREIAHQYLTNIDNHHIILPIPDESNFQSVWHLFVVQVENRDGFRSYMGKMGIETHVHYPRPIYEQSGYEIEGSRKMEITDMLAKRVVSLPIGSHLTDIDVEFVIEAINKFEP